MKDLFGMYQPFGDLSPEVQDLLKALPHRELDEIAERLKVAEKKHVKKINEQFSDDDEPGDIFPYEEGFVTEFLLTELGGLSDATSYETKVKGSTYLLPEYLITPEGIRKSKDFTTLKFVRGSVAGEGVEKQQGVIHESLINMIIDDLRYKNGLVPSEDSVNVLHHLESALVLIRKRALTRVLRGVSGIYKK